MSGYLLDTGVIVALLDRRERYHQSCVEVVNSIDQPLLTCDAVITEACHLLRRIPGATDRMLENVESNAFVVYSRISFRAKTIRWLMQKYKDTPMDYADACLVDLATEFNTGRILTLDSDFHVYRWGQNRKFDMLIELSRA